MTAQTYGRANITALIESTDGPAAAAVDVDQLVAEWCQVLGIPFADLSAKENPE